MQGVGNTSFGFCLLKAILMIVHFENQFSAMLDSQSVPAVTKISHLKELLVLKVRQVIDGLSFNEDIYERAMKYLKEK